MEVAMKDRLPGSCTRIKPDVERSHLGVLCELVAQGVQKLMASQELLFGQPPVILYVAFGNDEMVPRHDCVRIFKTDGEAVLDYDALRLKVAEGALDLTLARQSSSP
jgi:hypothetical protein